MPVPPISQLPIAPQVTDTPAVFSNRANTFVAALSTFVTETNATVDEINAAVAGALVLFDAYEGDWEAGSYGEGDVVRKDGVFYISLTDSNTQEPPDSDWQELLTAAATPYDNTTSGLAATNVQAAIDEQPRSVISDTDDTGEVTTTHTNTVIASQNSQSSGINSAVIASEEGIANGFSGTSVISSLDSSAGDNFTSVIASNESNIVFGTFSAVIASQRSEARSQTSVTIASVDSRSNGLRNLVVASSRTHNDDNGTLVLGSGSSPNSTANRKIQLFAGNGNINIAGSLTSNASFSDFAEMMPNGTGAEIPAGTILTLDNGEVRPANDGDDICGVVSHTGAVLAGDTPFCWQGRYLCDEFGRRLFETIPDPDWEPSEGQTEADRPDITVLKENPEWDPSLPQVPRSERPDEWTPVGIIGQVYVRTGEAVQSGDKLKAVAGVGFKSTERTGLRVMTVTKEYDGDYGIARCMLNVIV